MLCAISFIFSASCHSSEGTNHLGEYILFSGRSARDSASVSLISIPYSSPFSRLNLRLVISSISLCHIAKMAVAPRTSVRTFRDHSQRSIRIATVGQWNEFPRAAHRVTSSLHFSTSSTAGFLKRARVYPRLYPISVSLSELFATRLSPVASFLKRNSGLNVYGGYIILASRHLARVASSQDAMPAGWGGGRDLGIALVNVGRHSSSLSSCPGQLKPGSNTDSRGSFFSLNLKTSVDGPSSRSKLPWSSISTEPQ